MNSAFFEHPEYKKLKEFGIGSSDDNLRCFLVYMDLVECKRWYGVRLIPDHGLQIVFIGGHPTSTENLNLVWPVSASSTLSMDQMLAVIRNLPSEFSTNEVMLGVSDADSSVSYYQLVDDLVPPKPPSENQHLKEKQLRRKRRFRMRRT